MEGRVWVREEPRKMMVDMCCMTERTGFCDVED